MSHPFKYLSKEFPGGDLDQWLHMMHMEGWELVTTRGKWTYIFRRREQP